jgi:HD-like signal output (HDOD) protein/CheY-like chemotaxis protein
MSEPTTTILLVDDEPDVLSALRRVLRREGWNLLFAESAKDGLALLAEHSVDLVLTDMRMPQMDGVAFLQQVSESWPATIRIGLTGYTEPKMLARAFSEGHIHEITSKPWKGDDLRAILRNALTRAAELRQIDPALKGVINAIYELPVLPQAYRAVCEALQDDSQAPIDAVAAVVLETPPIAARLLQAANTSIFGQQRKIATVSQAIVVLGLKMVQNIVLVAGIIEDIKTLDGKDLSAKQLWQHSIGCGSIASHLAKERGESTAVQETAMLAGILHDIGKLVLAKCLPVSYVNILREAVRQNVSIATVEREKLGTDHGAVGGILAEWWHLPPQVVDAIRFHTNPASADAELITHLVHVANVLVHQLDIGFSGTTAPPEVSAATLTRLNIELEDLGSLAETLPDLVFRVID